MRLEPSQRGQETSAISPLEEVNSRGARLLVPLRVLYTLNTSPQYLLARTRHRVEVVPVLENVGNKHAPISSERTGSMVAKQGYGKVPLKACLGIVCNASPELICDRSRDYSVYVVDPLESPRSDENVSHASARLAIDMPSGSVAPVPWAEGVSIGMGLMSWRLAENKNPSPGLENEEDEGYVVGKFVRDRGTDALEIMLSLRETATQTQHQHALSLSSWGLPTPSTIVNPGDASLSPQTSSPLSNSFPPPGPSRLSENLEGEGLLGIEKYPISQACLSAPGTIPPPSKQDNRPARAKTKKIGRPQGAKTHPEKRARQLAIQMHKEKLERLLNIVKMQNGEEYDKTLIIASECETKVTEEIIAREQRLLEELQSRPLIVDGPRYTTQPLPRRAASPATHSPLVQIVAPTRKRKTTTQGTAAAPVSDSTRKDTPGESVESKRGATTEECQTTLLLSLLGSVLGKVDEPPINDGTGAAGACPRNEKGKEKQTFPFVNDALANALQKLLPYLPNPAPQSNACPIGTSSRSSTNAKSGQLVSAIDSQNRSEIGRHMPYLERPYPRLFKTADESFYSDPERGPSLPYDNHGGTTRSTTSKGDVPKVREDAHPVPGGGWARGRNIVPRAIAPTIPTTSHDGSTGDPVAARPSVSMTVAAPDKENMPPARSKRGLKRSFSSTDAKENMASTDVLSFKRGTKKKKQEDIARSARSKITNRDMVGSAENGKATSRTQSIFPASSPVRSTILTSPPRSLPVMALSEPDASLPRSGTPLGGNILSDELTGSLIAPSVPRNSAGPPMTPPRYRILDSEPKESLFTPCAPMSAFQLADVLPGSENAPSAPSSIVLNPPGHTDDLPEHQSSGLGEVECGQGATLTSRHVGTGWDLPPSSPPPPTSPILPDNDLTAEENQMDWDFAMQLQSELDVEMEKSCADRRFEDYGTTINCADTSTPTASVHILDGDELSDQPSTFEATVSAFDASSDDVFGELGQFDESQGAEGSDGMGLDIDELWGSLGPVIAHAQLDVSANTEFGFYGLANDQTLVDQEEQGAVDPIKLAEDLKALFGGCVV